MKKRGMRFICLMLAVIFACGQLTAFAEQADTRLSELETLMDTLAEDMAERNEEWYILDMSAYDMYSENGASSEAAVEQYKEAVITTAAKPNATASELAKAIMILRSAGYDAKNLVAANNERINAVAKLKETAIASYYEAPWVLMAELQESIGYSTDDIRGIIDEIKESVSPSGIFTYSYEWDGVIYSGDDIDTTGTVLAALAPYYLAEEDEYGVHNFVDTALSALSEKQLPGGSFGNANSDAMVMIALSALGINPDTDARFIKGENSLLDGMLSYLTESRDAFGYMDNVENDFATEQAFRAIIAAAGVLRTGEAYNVYDFSSVTVEEAVIGGNPGGGLPEEEPPIINDEITVYFTLLGRNGAVWLPRRAVKVQDGERLSYVIKKVMDSNGYTCEGLENGYISKITRPSGSSLSQFEHGANSGWLYKVDNEVPNMGIGVFRVYDRADLVLYYTGDWTSDPLAGFDALAGEDKNAEEDDEDAEKRVVSAAKAAEYVKKTVAAPRPSTIGGEWAVLGLVRGGYSDRAWEKLYYDELIKTLTENNGVLNARKYTEYARAAIALTSIKVDARHVAGYNLISKLDDYEKVTAQGINGALFALIAADCAKYELQQRDKYVELVLSRQLKDGGFAIAGEDAESDVTAMAITALAAYSDRAEVRTAINKAVSCLSKLQSKSGAFVSGGGDTVESTAQVIVALTTLGISIDDERFVKDGNTVYDALMAFSKGDGSFSHTIGEESDMLATEQALYALVALERASEGKTPLYDMSDIKPGSFEDTYFDENFDAIEALVQKGIVNGIGNKKFAPQNEITRAEFAAITVRAFGLSEEKSDVFSDVLSSDWFAGYVGTAHKSGIIKGVSPTSFLPRRNISRAEAVTMVARAAALAGIDIKVYDEDKTLSELEDGEKIPQWAREGAAFCVGTEILKKGDVKFLPDEAVKRSEMAGMIWKMLKIAEKI